MTQTEYEQKKRECWEEFKEKHFYGNAPWSPYSAFDFTFDRAYALCKQEKDAEDTVISGWVARDEDGKLYLHRLHPERGFDDDRNVGLWGNYIGGKCDIPSKLFSSLTWDDTPEPVEIIIKRKKNG